MSKRNHSNQPTEFRFVSSRLKMVHRMLMLTMLSIFLNACQGLKTRSDVGSGPSTKPSAKAKDLSFAGASNSDNSTSPPSDPAQPGRIERDGGEQSDDNGKSDSLAQPPQLPIVALGPQPKVGLILGSGGLKAYAHIGVLKEFEKARIPIHAIAGLEWGALAAALYAEKASANDVDWRLNRLREADLPSRSWLPGSRPVSADQYSEFFKTAQLNAVSMQQLKTRFACPVVSTAFPNGQPQAALTAKLGSKATTMLEAGPVEAVLNRCLALSPLYKSGGLEMAGASAVAEASAWLKARGATLIVFVNVLGGTEIVSKDLAERQPAVRELWNEVRHQLYTDARPQVANWVLNIETRDYALDDFSGRRGAQLAGEKAARSLTEKLSKQYGF